MIGDPRLHEVVITAIVYRCDRYLLERRAPTKKRFPGKWSVPGGRLESADYVHLPRDSEHYWYNVLERTLRREVAEEVGVEIRNIEYVTSLARVHEDGAPSLVISCMAEYAGGEVITDPEEASESRWVTLEEAERLELIDGIYDELILADQKRRGELSGEWRRVPADVEDNVS